MKKKSNGNYAVGRGKPPIHTQFKKGQSGNPTGRPKRTPRFRDKVAKVLAKTQTINIRGKDESMSLEDIIIHSIIQNAIRCKNTKAIMVAIEWCRELDQERRRIAREDARAAIWPNYTRESLMKMTHEEQLALYNRTMDENDPERRQDDDDDDDDD